MRAITFALRAFRKADIDLAALRWDDPASHEPVGYSTKVFALTGSPPQDALTSFRRAAVLAVNCGVKTVRVDISELAVLDSAVIATLILVLRAARERGAGVVLRAQHECIVETLRLTALDKLFAVEVLAAPAFERRAQLTAGER